MSKINTSAQFVNTYDGHGTQFEIHFPKGVDDIPAEILKAIQVEFESGSTLYVDGIRLEDGSVVFSLCRGGIHLALVDNRHNHKRADGKFHVIQRQEIDSDGNANLPRFVA